MDKSSPQLCLLCLALSECFLFASLLPPLADGEEPDKVNPSALKNGHTVPIGGPGVGNLHSQEEEATRSSSLRKSVLVEEPKKRHGKKPAACKMGFLQCWL